MLSRVALTAAVLAVTVTAGSGALAANHNVIANSDDEFVSSAVTVTQGDTVTWTNSGGNHNVHFDGMPAENPVGGPGWTVTRTFNTVGSFHYVCDQHAPGMQGTITVVASSAPPPVGQPPPGQQPPGGGGPPAGPGPAPSVPLLRITLKVSDATPTAGAKVRLSGVVRPARDGRRVQIQKRLRSGKYVTVAGARLRDSGTAKSQFSLRLRVSADAVLRARVAGDDERGTGLSATKKLDVHRRPRA